MDIATKAALFSALLFPGWGQFYLKHYKRGLIFIVPVLAATLALVWSIIDIGISIIKATPFKKGTDHLTNAIQVAVDALKAINLSYFMMLLIIISIFWILSIIDAYQLGKKIMTAPTTASGQESISDQA
jgi:TM2 domain-containing membrane protein YozV